MRRAKPAATLVVRSRFVIANGMTDEVRAAFRARLHLVIVVRGWRKDVW